MTSFQSLFPDAGCKRRIFVCEFVTGGGCLGRQLPEALLPAGDAMLKALLTDLNQLPTVETTTTRDARLLPLTDGATHVHSLRAEAPPDWQQFVAEASAVWWIAPETDGILERLTRQTLNYGGKVLGCEPHIIALCADKLSTLDRLEAAGIPVAPARPFGDSLPQSTCGWVVKPRDGAGCEMTYLCRDEGELASRLGSMAFENCLIQTHIPGEAASLSLLCANGDAELLACNRQHVYIRDNTFCFEGVQLNALTNYRPIFEDFSTRIAATMPGLWGFVGIDLVIGADGPVVIEVNPRLTTAYVGLSAALGYNVAERILSLPVPDWWPTASPGLSANSGVSSSS